jgi:hypothetical protein
MTGPQGLQGETGITGPQGLQGFQGQTGPQGFQGETGITGPQGLQGFQGQTGPQGFQGFTGELGPLGPTGPSGGPQGFQGPTGEIGPQGFQGETGPQGFQGETGQIGPTGPFGVGPQGASGLSGAQGEPGATGPQGATGVGAELMVTIGSTGIDMAELSSDLLNPGTEPFIAHCLMGDCFKIWGCVEYEGGTGVSGIEALRDYPSLRVTVDPDQIGFPDTDQEIVEESSIGIWTGCLYYDKITQPGRGESFSGKVFIEYDSEERIITLVFRNCYLFNDTVTEDSSFDPLSFMICGHLAERTQVGMTAMFAFDSMNSISDSGSIPPDPCGAAGPDHLVAVINRAIAIYDKKTGANLFQQGLSGGSGFWGSVGATVSVFDPWIEYDHHAGRFVVVAIEVLEIADGDPSDTGFLYLAVSKNSRPTGGDDWHKYQFDRTKLAGGAGTETFPDYEKLGYDEKAYYISGNDFEIVSGSFAFASIFVLDKAPLLIGDPAVTLFDTTVSGFSLHTVINYDAPTDAYYFVESRLFNPSTTIRIWALTDIFGSPTLSSSSVTVTNYRQATNITQPDAGLLPISVVGTRIMSGCVRNGRLWTSHAIRNDPAGAEEAITRWYEFDVSSFPGSAPTLIQEETIDPSSSGGLSDDQMWMTHINVDRYNNMAIGLSIAGGSRFGGMGAVGRLSSDTPSTTSDIVIFKDGESNYEKDFGTGRNRWGDYSGLALDPDGRTFWLFHEYSALPMSTWQTRWVSFRMGDSRPILDRSVPQPLNLMPLSIGEIHFLRASAEYAKNYKDETEDHKNKAPYEMSGGAALRKINK